MANYVNLDTCAVERNALVTLSLPSLPLPPFPLLSLPLSSILFNYIQTDINECDYGKCDRHVTCNNTIGNFSCGPCPKGYVTIYSGGCYGMWSKRGERGERWEERDRWEVRWGEVKWNRVRRCRDKRKMELTPFLSFLFFFSLFFLSSMWQPLLWAWLEWDVCELSFWLPQRHLRYTSTLSLSASFPLPSCLWTSLSSLSLFPSPLSPLSSALLSRFSSFLFNYYLLIYITSGVCGDGVCDPLETCKNCYEDCRSTCGKFPSTLLFYPHLCSLFFSS